MYRHCRECGEINTHPMWCRACTAARFRKDFNKWGSGNTKIDSFIQNTQIHAWKYSLVSEWFPWSTFSMIEEIGKGAYATVYRAKSKSGRIYEWDQRTKKWNRDGRNDYVALKTLGHCESLSDDFLNDVTNLHSFIHL